jgi:hypothetical protein
MTKLFQITTFAGALALFTVQAAQDQPQTAGSQQVEPQQAEPQQPQRAQNQPTADRQEISIPARHDHARGNCDGKFYVREDGIAFESVGEASHSRSWKYDEIEELERNRSENKVIIDSKNTDDDFTLKLEGDMDEQLYETLKERIVAARARQ